MSNNNNDNQPLEVNDFSPQEAEVLTQETVAEQTEQESAPSEHELTFSPEQLSEMAEGLVKELEEKNNQLLRTAAEFDNYKKRTTTEREKFGEYAKVATLKAILPSVDNINRALIADQNSAEYISGVELSLKSLLEALKSLGLEQFGAAGDDFNPDIHNAVMHIEDGTLSENTVAEVFEAGYKLGENVIRPAMVKVAN